MKKNSLFIATGLILLTVSVGIVYLLFKKDSTDENGIVEVYEVTVDGVELSFLKAADKDRFESHIGNESLKEGEKVYWVDVNEIDQAYLDYLNPNNPKILFYDIDGSVKTDINTCKDPDHCALNNQNTCEISEECKNFYFNHVKGYAELNNGETLFYFNDVKEGLL